MTHKDVEITERILPNSSQNHVCQVVAEAERVYVYRNMTQSRATDATQPDCSSGLWLFLQTLLPWMSMASTWCVSQSIMAVASRNSTFVATSLTSKATSSG